MSKQDPKQGSSFMQMMSGVVTGTADGHEYVTRLLVGHEELYKMPH